MSTIPIYDPDKSYEQNYRQGPFGGSFSPERLTRTGKPEKKFLGHPVYEPFGVPAGPLLNSLYVLAALQGGVDVPVYKTVRTKAHACLPFPNILAVEVDGDLTLEKASQPLVARPVRSQSPANISNSFGVPSQDPAVWQPDLAKAVQAAGVGQVVIGSFQGSRQESGRPSELIADYVLAAKLVVETGAKIVEANLSCPNEGTADLLCFDVVRVQQIADAIKNEIGNLPLILKLAYFANQDQLAKFVQAVGTIVDGVSAINTISATLVDPLGNQALPGPGRDRSGVCGAGIKWAGLDMVRRLAQLRQENGLSFSIVGVGGVMTVNDYLKYIEAGADAVMSATGYMWNVGLASEIGKLSGDTYAR